MSTRIVLVGAGSAQFGYDMLGDVFQSDVLEGAHVVLHDIDPHALARVCKAGDAFVEAHSLPFSLTATSDRQEALAGADFCVIAIEVGDRFALWDQDRNVPEQFGFRQVFGENGGPGGLFHALRVTPPILDICADIARICPNAIVFNYSNPMSRICTTVARRFPELRFVGLCHEIASLRQHLPLLLDRKPDEIEYRAGGLNHFSILTEVRFKDTGEDAYPLIREKAPDYFRNLPDVATVLEQLIAAEAGSTPGSEPALRKGAGAWAERGLFRVLLEEFGVLPITTDSHLGEYVQWAPDVVDQCAILDFYNFYQKWIARSDPKIELRCSERVVPIIEGVIGDTGYEEAAVNVPNFRCIANLPGWLVVEVPGIVDAKGVHGLSPGELPPGFRGLLSNQVAVHDLTAEAILQHSKELVVQALLVDPTVQRYDRARELVDVMISLQSQWLGYLD